jgi:hypothetical protein
VGEAAGSDNSCALVSREITVSSSRQWRPRQVRHDKGASLGSAARSSTTISATAVEPRAQNQWRVADKLAYDRFLRSRARRGKIVCELTGGANHLKKAAELGAGVERRGHHRNGRICDIMVSGDEAEVAGADLATPTLVIIVDHCHAPFGCEVGHGRLDKL